MKPNFVALDLETATSYRGSICQIGITEVADGVPKQPKSWLVRPEGNEYDEWNIWIHGITPKDTKNSPSFDVVWKEVQPYIEGRTVVAHNTSFDMYALRNAFDDYGIEYPTFDYFCSLRIARYIVKGCYSYSLNVLAEQLGLEFGTHHRADSDSLGCALVLLKCLELDGSDLDDLEAKYKFHRGKFAPGQFVAQLSTNKGGKSENVLKSLEAHPELVDVGNYFYGKNVCFTGKCQFGTRKKLLQKVMDIGGVPSDSVSSATEVLVVGQQDYRVVGDSGLSGKQKRALQLLEKGQDIEILSEAEFLDRI